MATKTPKNSGKPDTVKLPAVQQRIVDFLQKQSDDLLAADIATGANVPNHTIRVHLDRLLAKNLVDFCQYEDDRRYYWFAVR